MTEEEKEAIEKLNEIIKQWQQIINIEDEEEREIEMSLYFEEMPFKNVRIALNLISKLQKENQELKEENIILEGRKIGLKLAIQKLKEKLDYYSYYKEKESQEFDERDYYEE